MFLIVAGSNFDNEILGNDNLSVSRKWIIVFGVCQGWNKFVDCMKQKKVKLPMFNQSNITENDDEAP